MNSLINNSFATTPFGFGAPITPSFSSPFSTPFASGFGQIGTPMFTNSFSNSFGTPFNTPFGGFSPFTTPVNGFGFGQPIWNQGFGGQFTPPVSPFGFAPFGGTPFDTTSFGFNSFGQLPFGGFSPFSTPFGSSFAGSFGGQPQSDWSIFGGRFGGFPSSFTSQFSTPFAGSFGLPFGSFGQFGGTPFGGSYSSPFGFQNGWNTGFTGFSPITSNFVSPLGGSWNQPISSGFSPISSGLTAHTGVPFTSPISQTTGFGGVSTGTSGLNGQNVHGYSSSTPVITGTGPSTGFNGTTPNPALNTSFGLGQTGFAPTGIGTHGTLPAQLVAGQFASPVGGQFVGQGWNGPITGNTPNLFTGQPIFQAAYPTGFQAQGSHGNPSELRNAAGTTINVSQRDAA